jgi:hypothetical protein
MFQVIVDSGFVRVNVQAMQDSIFQNSRIFHGNIALVFQCFSRTWMDLPWVFMAVKKSGSFLEVQWLNARSLGKMEGWSWDYHSMEYPAW